MIPHPIINKIPTKKQINNNSFFRKEIGFLALFVGDIVLDGVVDLFAPEFASFTTSFSINLAKNLKTITLFSGFSLMTSSKIDWIANLLILTPFLGSTIADISKYAKVSREQKLFQQTFKLKFNDESEIIVNNLFKKVFFVIAKAPLKLSNEELSFWIERIIEEDTHKLIDHLTLDELSDIKKEFENYLSNRNNIYKEFGNKENSLFEKGSHIAQKIDQFYMHFFGFYAIRILFKKIERKIISNSKILKKFRANTTFLFNKISKRLWKKILKLSKKEGLSISFDSEWILGIIVRAQNKSINDLELMKLEDKVNVIVYFNPETTRSPANPSGKKPVMIYGLDVKKRFLPWLKTESKGSYYYKHIMWGFELGKFIRQYGIFGLVGSSQLAHSLMEYRYLAMDISDVIKLSKKTAKDHSLYKALVGKNTILKEFEEQAIFGTFSAFGWRYAGGVANAFVFDKKRLKFAEYNRSKAYFRNKWYKKNRSFKW